MSLKWIEMNRKVVVLSAFACDPNIPSEPSIGWAYLKTWINLAASEGGVEVLALMNERSKAATDSRLLEEDLDPEGCLQTVGVSLPRFLKFLENPYLTRLEYLAWSARARKYLKGLSSEDDVVLARHVTFASELLPTPISVLKDRALTVWGPVGSSGVADAFRIHPRHPQWRSHFVFQKLRDLVSRVQSRRIGAGVDIVLATSERLAADLQSTGISSQTFPNTRVDPALVDKVAENMQAIVPGDPHADSQLNLLCVGNLVYLKRFELAIATLADPRLKHARLDIVGKPAPGKENYLLRVAADLDVAERVAFRGQLSQDDVIRLMSTADVFIHPSTREGGSGVVGEATAVGVPVVCFRGTGAGVVLEYAGGHGVQVDVTKKTSVKALTDAIVKASRLKRSPALLWRGNRYQKMERSLLDMAVGRQGTPRS